MLNGELALKEEREKILFIMNTIWIYSVQIVSIYENSIPYEYYFIKLFIV